MTDFKLGFLLRQKVVNSAAKKAEEAFQKLETLIAARAEQGFSDFETTASSIGLYGVESIALLIKKLEDEDLIVAESVRENPNTWMMNGAAGIVGGIGGTPYYPPKVIKETYISIRW
jgi:hypothetical protein